MSVTAEVQSNSACELLWPLVYCDTPLHDLQWDIDTTTMVIDPILESFYQNNLKQLADRSWLAFLNNKEKTKIKYLKNCLGQGFPLIDIMWLKIFQIVTDILLKVNKCQNEKIIISKQFIIIN